MERSVTLNGGLLNGRLQQQIRAETRVWKDILENIMGTMCTIAQPNLALRGHLESITEDFNPGNFLAFIKYLNKFYPVMKAHVESVFFKQLRCSRTRFTIAFIFIQLRVPAMWRKCLRLSDT